MSEVQKSEPKSVVTVTGTWDGARHWLNAAKMFEQGKLFAQVMFGFELLALQKAHGVTNGSNQFQGRVSHNGKPSDDWETILQRETGVAMSTAYRYMDMAKAATPRLKKLPALKNFDPFANSLSSMAEPQRAALESTVKKLTDGKTQTEFGEQLGLWKKPKGSGSTGRAPGEGGDGKKPTFAEQAELQKLQASADWADLQKILNGYRDKFLLLSDDDVEAQTAVLELHLSARKAWLKQPHNRRDPKAIAELFKK